MKQRVFVRRLYQGLAWMTACGCICLCACGSAEAADRDTALPATADASACGETEAINIRIYEPQASGEVVISQYGVTIDASHTDQGYVMIKSEPNPRRLKVRIGTPVYTYNYDLPSDNAYQVYPFQQGDGKYSVRVMENVEGDLYSQLLTTELTVRLTDPNNPFLYPNQFVSFHAGSEAVARAYLLVGDLKDEGKIVKRLYNFVADNTAYDYDKAATVPKGYLPDVDETLNSGKGICFDYSSLLAAMLRAKGIPCKVVVGVVSPENILHAWNNVYIDGEWVWYDATFDGTGHKERDYTQERIY